MKNKIKFVQKFLRAKRTLAQRFRKLCHEHKPRRNSLRVALFFVVAVTGGTFTVALGGCKNVFSETENVVISLPAWPPQNSASGKYPPLVRWEVSLFDGEKVTTVNVPPGEQKFSTSVRRNSMAAFVFAPVTESDSTAVQFFLPAGCIYPFYLEADWRDGWAANVAIEAAKNSLANIEKFNWNKLVENMRKRTVKDSLGNDVPCNPWSTEEAKIANRIDDGAIKTSDFSSAQRYVLASEIILKNAELYRTTKESGKKLTSPKAGQFYKTSEEMVMALSENSDLFANFDATAAQEIFFAEYIPDQNEVCQNTAFLRYQTPVYFLSEKGEIISLNYRSKTKINIAIISALDYTRL